MDPQQPLTTDMCNIFLPAVSDQPIVPRRGHPVARDKIVNQSTPLQTNKFYANMFLGNQTCSTWTHPYSLSWSKGSGNARSWGMAISLIERNMLALGPIQQPQNASQYYINPIGIQYMILSASELGGSTSFTMNSLREFSANATLAQSQGATPVVSFPLVQGMGFVTGVYTNATPRIESSVFFRSFAQVGQVNSSSTRKYRVVLEDGSNWLIYVTSNSGAEAFQYQSNTLIQGPGNFSGIIQIAKNNQGNDGEAAYDQSAGAYATSCSKSASVNGATATYTLSWAKAGAQKPLIMYALSHHVQSFDSTTSSRKTLLTLQTTTKGLATGVLSDSWSLVEQLPVDIGFAPWGPDRGSVNSLSGAVVNTINGIAANELNTVLSAWDSMYFSGKQLARYAVLIWTVKYLCRNDQLAATGLSKLKDTFAVFINNRQQNPLAYDTTWGGVVSTAGLNGDSGADFGNSWYNDHHFHYGYHVFTAAVIGSIDPNWLNEGNNRAWVNMLVGDFASATENGNYPVSRNFDWFHGHSWAKGIFESADGKDEESTSEDSFASYGLKMWGRTTGDAALEARGNLMLAIQKRTFQSYFLMDSGNINQPPQFINNKVTGILFENKADHATYFGMNTEYIQGIHMLPVNPVSPYIRSARFIREEWDTYFSNGRVDQVAGGWRGVLYSNLGLVDPRAAWNFFTRGDFNSGWLDDGASRSWYLAFAAALGGA